MATHKTSPNVCNQNNTNSTVIDAYALARIDYRVQKMARRFKLPQDQQEDLRQDMAVELLTAFQRFNPDKASRKTFVNRVLDKFVKYTMRNRSIRRRRACDSPIHFDDIFPGFEPVSNDAATGVVDEQVRRELRIDMDAAIARMPKRLRRVCSLLKEFDATEVAEQLGIRRQSVYRIMDEIREYLNRAGVGISENSATDSAQLQM